MNLLRRNISTRELLTVSFAEWKKSGASTAKYSHARIQEAEAIYQAEISRSAKDQDPIRAYRKIQSVLENRKSSASSEEPAAESNVTETTAT